MSKNTGTSELINYFDLGVNGDVGISGNLTLDTIANATTDTDTFLVSDTGIIKYRTGAQLLSDIGAAPAVAGGYVPYTGATTNVDLGVYNLTTSAIIANGSGSNSGIVHLESNAIHSLVNGYGSIASGTTNQFNLYQTTGAGVFRGAILSLNSITEFATRTFTLPDTDGTIALTSNIPANAVGGTGTTNYLPKFTGSTTIGNSVIQESGGLIGIGSTPSYLLNVISASDNSLLEIKSTATANNTALRIGIDGNNAFINATGGSTGILEFRTYGSAKAIITQTGNLLIGNPPASDNGARLQVSGEGRFYQPLTNTTSYLTVENNRARNAAIRLKTTVGDFLIGTGIGADVNQFQIYDNTAGANRLVISSTGASTFNLGSGEMRLNRTGTSEFLKLNTYYLLSDGNDQLLGSVTGATSIYAGNGVSPRLTITSSGNVGIGTASSNASSGYKMLRINGATTGGEIVLAGAEVEYGYMYANSGNFVIDALASQPMRFRTGAQNRMEISSAGKVEMGNALVSGEILKVIGPAGADNYISAYSGSIHMFLDADATNQAGIVGTQSSHNLILRTAGTNKVWITPSGNVLIGTSTDNGDRMNISGAVSISTNLGVGRGSESGVRLSISASGTSSAAYGVIIRDSLGNDLFVIRNDGYMLTGSRAFSPYNNTSGVSANMVVGADGTLYRSTSSLKYKTDVKDYDKGLSEVLKMRSVYYKGKNDGDIQFAGLIAEEIHELGLTEFVQYAQDGTPDALAYSNMISLLVKAIQEQQVQIDKLKNL